MSRRACIRALGPALVLALSACAPDEDAPYLKIVGGGFVFNYRLATADYGFVARVMRDIPTGTIVRAEFENPAGGPPIVIEQRAREDAAQYVFTTPPVHGVRSGRDYQVALRLVDPATHELIASYGRSYRSDYDQEILPDAPTVVGPGYQRPGEPPPGTTGKPPDS
jgi:hypothetical protein